MAKDIITNVLRTSLLRFVKDASGDQLHLRHLLSGHVELGPDVQLAEPAIQQVLLDLGLPASLEVLRAHADHIRVHIPWAKLLGQSTRLVMGQLTVQVRVHNVDVMAQVLEGAAQGGRSSTPPEAQNFLTQQRERLEAMVQRRCGKPAEGLVRRMTLLETVVQGLRLHVNSLRLEIFRDIDGYENPPSRLPYFTLQLNGFTISPCTSSKRPTLELAEARAAIAVAETLVEPLTPHVFRRLFRLDSANAWVRRDAQRYDPQRLPWSGAGTAELWCPALRFGAFCLRTSFYQAAVPSRTRSLGAYMVEDGAALGYEKVLDLEPPDDLGGAGKRSAALTVDMEVAMALELAELGGHFFSGFGVSNGWCQQQIERRLPAIIGLPAACAASPSSRAREAELQAAAKMALEEVEPVKEAVDSFLREGFRAERRSSMERRGSVDVGGPEKATLHGGMRPRAPGEKVLVSGWLTKRAKLRPFQDSWQERWCELSQLPRGQGILRYSASSTGRQLKGEIHLAPNSGAFVTSFEDEVARLRARKAQEKRTSTVRRSVSGFLSSWSQSHAALIVEEFQHGFALRTAPEAPHSGRVFFFATERDSETRRWTEALRSVLAPQPQTLEEFLGEGTASSPSSPGITCLDEKDVSEVATEDISDDESACSFVSVEEELADRPAPARSSSSLASDLSNVETVEETLGRTKVFSTFKVNMASLRVRLGFDSIANPLKGILDEKIPKHMSVHAFLGNIQLNMSSQCQQGGAAVAPMAKLMGTVSDGIVEQLLQRSATWSTHSTTELTVGEVIIKRPDCHRTIALGQRPNTSHIRIYFENREDREAGQPLVTKSGTCFSASLVQLFTCLDVPALTSLKIFLAQLGKAFSPDISTVPTPPAEDPLALIKAMAAVSLQLRLEGLEVEVPLPGMPLSGKGMRISIGQMQFSSLEAVQHFANALSRQPSMP